MRYKTPAALEMAVKEAAKKSPLDTNRAIAGFYLHRLLCRVFSGPDSPFVLKGGQNVLARTVDARATRDIDLLARNQRRSRRGSGDGHHRPGERTIFDMVPGRKQTDLDSYFSSMEGLDRVQWVCSDMYRPFWRSVAKYAPNATWVIDHLHVVKGANEALDTVRKGLQGSLDKKGRLELKKNLVNALRKHTQSLNAYEASALRELRGGDSYTTLMTAYDLEEDFFDIYDENPASREGAEAAFDAWSASIPKDKAFEPFRALARTVENRRECIFNYWDCPSRISNGYTECANRLINETDMKGRGYSFETLRTRMLYRRQNLDRIIAGNGLAIGPRIDVPEPPFVTEPDVEDELVDEFIDPRSGTKVDAKTGEIL